MRALTISMFAIVAVVLAQASAAGSGPSSAPVSGSMSAPNNSGIATIGQHGDNFIINRPPSTPAHRPDLALRFVEPTIPALEVHNVSKAIARDIKWQVWFLDIDGPRDAKGILQPLPIPLTAVDWIRPHDHIQRQVLFTPLVLNFVKPGDRIYGSAMVLCAECKRSHSYLVFIKFGEGGWFMEDKRMKDGEARFPIATDEDRDAYVREIDAQPLSARRPILN
jgi:hypothetical protein